MSSRFTRTIVIILLIVANAGCDQISKKIVRIKMFPNESVHMLGNHILLTRVENSGAFLSMGDSFSSVTKSVMLTFLPLVVLVFGVLYLLRNPHLSTPFLVGFCFVLGGGIGNIFDRAMFSSVTDFLYLQWGIFHTGVFNFADLSITIGVILIVTASIFRKAPINGS